MTAPPVAWVTGNVLASSNAPAFTWPTSPAPAAGDYAVAYIQSKSTNPTSPSLPGFTKIAGPTNNPNGNASTTIWVKTCTGSETGTVTGSGFNTGQQDVVVIAFTAGALDATAVNLVAGTGTADTSHALATTTTTGPDRTLCSGCHGRYSATTTTGNTNLNPPATNGWVDQFELNVGVSGTNNETIGVATTTQTSAGTTFTGNWGSSAKGLFSNNSIVAIYQAFTVWAGAAAGASSSSGTADTVVRRSISAAGASTSAGTCNLTTTAAHDLTGHAASSSLGSTMTAFRQVNPGNLAGASSSTASLNATLQRGYALIMAGGSRSNGDMFILLIGDRPTDVPPQREVGDTGHMSDHELIRVALAWLIGRIPQNLPDDTTPAGWG